MHDRRDVIKPYWLICSWVFGVPSTGLFQEPFVSGVTSGLGVVVAESPNARQGFRLLFSPAPFPGYQRRLEWDRQEFDGNWYRLDKPPMEGWLCPAVFLYFNEAPAALSVKAEEIK